MLWAQTYRVPRMTWSSLSYKNKIHIGMNSSFMILCLTIVYLLFFVLKSLFPLVNTTTNTSSLSVRISISNTAEKYKLQNFNNNASKAIYIYKSCLLIGQWKAYYTLQIVIIWLINTGQRCWKHSIIHKDTLVHHIAHGQWNLINSTWLSVFSRLLF